MLTSNLKFYIHFKRLIKNLTEWDQAYTYRTTEGPKNRSLAIQFGSEGEKDRNDKVVREWMWSPRGC